MQDKGVGVFAEFPLWALDLWGGDLRGPRRVDSNWIARDSGRPERVRIVLGIFTLGAFPLGAANAFDLRVNQVGPPACLVVPPSA